MKPVLTYSNKKDPPIDQELLNNKPLNPRSSYQQQHSTYFEKLQEQLLQKSNRYTSLIGKKVFGSNISKNQTIVDKLEQIKAKNNINKLLQNTSNKISSQSKQRPSKNNSYSSLANSKKFITENSAKKTSSILLDHNNGKANPSPFIMSPNLSLVNLHTELDSLAPKYCISRQQTQRTPQIQDTHQNERNKDQFQEVNNKGNQKKQTNFKKQIKECKPDLKQQIRHKTENQSKIKVKINQIKNLISSYNERKKKQTDLELHRKLVYNLTYQNPTQNTLSDISSTTSPNKRSMISQKSNQPHTSLSKEKQKVHKDSTLAQTISTKTSLTNNNNQVSKLWIPKFPKPTSSNSQPNQSISTMQNLQKSLSPEKTLPTLNNVKSLVLSPTETSIITQHSHSSLTKQSHSSMSINDFVILAQIGQGKVGTVYMAKHLKTNFICALKVINRQILNPHLITQLSREIQVQFYLDHPNIIQLYAFFSDAHCIYLMLELCFSGNLYTHLRRQRILPEIQIKSIIKQICYALQYIHDNEIIHRDLKPENVLFHQNVVKICDFGWAVYSPLSRDTLCGTPIYASPQLVEKKKYNSKIDVWNVGIMTFQLLCGRVPFEIRSDQDLYKVIIQEIHFPKSIPVSEFCKDFICSSLKKQPEQRKTIAQLLQHPFLNQNF